MNEIFGKVDDYIKDLLAPEDEALKNTIKSLDTEGIPQISVSANQGKFLQVMMRSVNAKRVLELGTLGGYSTIWMARALPEDGEIVTVEYSEHHATVAQRNLIAANVSDKVEIITGKAIDVLKKMVADKVMPFDLIFIDADKPPYPEYFNYAIQLSRPGTMIICDNVIREGSVMDDGNTEERVVGVRRLNKMLKGDERITATIIQTVGAKEHDGMVLAVVN